MRATPLLSFSCWNNFFYDCHVYVKGVVGRERVGTGVPTPFSRFALKWVGSCFKMAIFWCVPTPFFLTLHPWFNRTLEQRRLHENHIGCLLFTLLAVQTDNLSSKLPTQTHQDPTSRTSSSDTITSCRKTAAVLKMNKVIFAEIFTSTAKT